MDKIRVDALKVNAGHHANITILGVCNALQGTSASILIGVSIYGFASINILAGWLAVGAFLACCATFAVGIANIYIMGLKAERSGANHAKINRWK